MTTLGAFWGIGALALAACSASGTTTGGQEKFDATPPEPPATTEDAGAGDATAADAGTAWTDLYRDYFGDPQHGCSNQNICHGAADQSGAQSSNGYVCGHDKDTCYKGITNQAVLPVLITPADAADPMKSNLIAEVLRRKSPGSTTGNMPQSPSTFVFSDADIARIAAWIGRGAPND